LDGADIIGAVASSPDPAAAPSLEDLRSRLIPTTAQERWDDGELPRAILHLHDHAALGDCELLLRLVCVRRRCLDEARASRTVALREVLLELLPDELDHPCCEVLRVLAGLEPGTAGRSREARQRIAGDRLGTPRFPSAPRTVRRRTKAECWPWLLDRLIELETTERRAPGAGSATPRAAVMAQPSAAAAGHSMGTQADASPETRGDARDRLELELAGARLDVGDAQGAVRLAKASLARCSHAGAHQAEAHRLLVEAAYMLGDVETERRRLDAWRGSDGEHAPQLLCGTAEFAARKSAPASAVSAAQRALDGTPAGSRIHVLAATTLSRALWSAGQPNEALAMLDACEREEPAVLASDPEARVAVDHAAALALHDLERNLRVVDHARRAVETYRATGRREAELVMGVNLGDGLWGAGRVTEARSVLGDAWMQAEAAGLPYAEDIAAICLANVLAVTGDHSRALELYDAGIELADRIGHDWDTIYGRVHQALGVAEADRHADPQALLRLSDRARDAGYGYLRSLAVAYAPLVAYAAGDTEAARWALGQASIRHEEHELACGPAAHLRGLEVLLAQAPSRGQAVRFVRALGRCEGLKGRPALVVQAIRRLRPLDLLDRVQTEFVLRWMARFATEVLEPRIGEELRLRACDYRACEARCCYDGVYLKDGEPERIRAAVASAPEFFAHLPESFIVHGEWAGVTGAKTAVRPHTFHSPDFPEHFNQTRCVFAFADGACSLQAFAAERGDDPWAYKPRACWMYPLRTVEGTLTPPRSALERDPQFLGQRYPGYTAYTPCGQQRSDGRPWNDTLQAEIRRAIDDPTTPST
jgi:tetratricopeptide (TPR) repeat protein